MSQILEKELKTYEQYKETLLETAEGKFALIKGDEIIGVYDTDSDAIREGYKRLGNVPFLAKRIVRIELPLNFTSNLLGI